MAYWVQELGESSHTEHKKPGQGGADLLLPDGGKLPAGKRLNFQGPPSRANNLCARLHDGARQEVEKGRPPPPPHLHWLCCAHRAYTDSLPCPGQRLCSCNLAKEQASGESSRPICSTTFTTGQARTAFLRHVVQRDDGQWDGEQDQQYSQQQPITEA